MEPDFIKLAQIKPALSGYIRKSELLLRSSAYPEDKTVHDIRVLMKKARAVLKLTLPQLEVIFTEREIKSLREVGRGMNALRELYVLRKTLRDLRKRYPVVFSKLEDNETLNILLSKPDLNSVKQEPEGLKYEHLLENLNKTGYRIRFEPMTTLEPRLLLKELEMTYNRVVNNYLICRNNPKPSLLHELRKSSKDFLYQLWFFRPLNPSVIKGLEKKLALITQNLGKYNDLAHVIKSIGYSYEYTKNEPALDELVLMIRKEQDRYLSRVWPAVYKIFCPGQNIINILGFKLLII